MKRGYTLLELVMVVLVIAILAIIAVPQFFKISERVKASEGINALASIRKSELSYYSQQGVFTNDMNELNVDIPNLRFFDFPEPQTDFYSGGPEVIAQIDRNITSNAGHGTYRLRIHGNGNITCVDNGGKCLSGIFSVPQVTIHNRDYSQYQLEVDAGGKITYSENKGKYIPGIYVFSREIDGGVSESGEGDAPGMYKFRIEESGEIVYINGDDSCPEGTYVFVKREMAPITFAVGGIHSEIDFWKSIAEEFENKTGIKVNILSYPVNTDLRRQSLSILLESKDKDPDVLLMDTVWLSEFAASGWLKDLNHYVWEEKLDLTVFFEKILNSADKYEKQLVAFPVYIDEGLLYYRKDLLNKYGYIRPPQTWEELVNFAEEIQSKERGTNPDFYGFVWPGARYEGLICSFLEFALSGGGGIFEGEKLSLDRYVNIKAVKFMHDLIHEYEISPPDTFSSMREEEVRVFFQDGNALFERNWPYAWMLHQDNDSMVKGRVGIASLPHFPGGRSVSVLGGWHIGISEFSDAKVESLEFLKFVISYGVQKSLALQLGCNPSRMDIYSDKDVIEKFPHFVDLQDIFHNAYARPNLSYYSFISDTIQHYVNSALAGKLSPQEALSSAQQEVQGVIKKYKNR